MTIRFLVVLVLRTVAIWGGDKRITVFLSVLLAGATATSAYFVNNFLQNLTGAQFCRVSNSLTRMSLVFLNFMTNTPECALDGVVNHLFICYAAMLGFETGELELPSVSSIPRYQVM
jgi:hypothetical protein